MAATELHLQPKSRHQVCTWVCGGHTFQRSKAKDGSLHRPYVKVLQAGALGWQGGPLQRRDVWAAQIDRQAGCYESILLPTGQAGSKCFMPNPTRHQLISAGRSPLRRLLGPGSRARVGPPTATAPLTATEQVPRTPPQIQGPNRSQRCAAHVSYSTFEGCSLDACGMPPWVAGRPQGRGPEASSQGSTNHQKNDLLTVATCTVHCLHYCWQ